MRNWLNRTRPIIGSLLIVSGLGLSYQNCSPELPAFGEGDFAPPPARATPPPGSQSWDMPSTGTDGTYTAPEWEGVCSTSDTNEPMILNTVFTNYTGTNVIHRRASDGAIAVWNVTTNRVNKGVVCRMNGSGWTMRAVGDFNGDRTQDVMWRNADGRNAIWLMQGAMRSSGGFLPSLGSEWHIEGTGDFNGDGKSDLLWVNWSTSTVVVWAMNGSSVISQTTLGGYASDFHIIGTADFNGDRKTDVIFRNNDGVSVIWFVASPSQVSSALVVQGNLDNSWQLLAASDVDGDGKGDLIWMNTASRVLRIAKMNSENTAETRDTQPVAANMTFVGMSDINQDNRNDMMFLIDSNALGMWFMNYIPQTGTTIGNISAGWQYFRYEHR